MNLERVNRISGRIVLGLSLFAMSLVVSALVLTMRGEFDPAPGGDEGTAAHGLSSGESRMAASSDRGGNP